MKKEAFVFDLDGTITQTEILPLIAEYCGLKDEIGALTDATIKGLISFESSFKLRVRLLNSLSVTEVQRIVSSVAMDSSLLDFIRKNRERCFIATGNLSQWIEPLKQKIGCTFFSSSATVVNDYIVGIESILDKGQAVREIRKKFSKITAVGDGANDVPMFEVADCRIAYGGVHPPSAELVKISDYVVHTGEGLSLLLKTLS